MKKYYIGIPSVIIFIFAFTYTDWSKKNHEQEETRRVETHAKVVEEAEVQARYQIEIQRKAKLASEEATRKKLEKKAKDEAEERYWTEINKKLNTALGEQETLIEKVYETTNALFLEQERHIRAKESIDRQDESERFLARYVPEARANRNEINTLLEKAEELAIAREFAAKEPNANLKRK